VQDRIRQAFAAACGPGAAEFVPLAELRRRLVGVPRAEVDAALDQMYRAQAINLVAQANQLALTSEDRAAALEIGGGVKHRISVR
jgi:hypothetical protein